ncbi:MAG: Hsp20/alpha crystallin family protein [Saprospiraceae bacterium]|nr:Hsp20/alpha crystallin family protein [Saprospiraceae bacterium]
MNYIKFNPFLPLQEGVDELVQSIFNSSVGDFVGSDFVSSHPKANVRESENGWLVELAAPGLSKDSFHIKIENSMLIVTAERSEKREKEQEGYFRKEFDFAGLKRSFPLKDEVDQEKITASYQDGVLAIHLPKMDNQDRRKTIVVE